jgi:hypothetical protein
MKMGLGAARWLFAPLYKTKYRERADPASFSDSCTFAFPLNLVRDTYIGLVCGKILRIAGNQQH